MKRKYYAYLRTEAAHLPSLRRRLTTSRHLTLSKRYLLPTIPPSLLETKTPRPASDKGNRRIDVGYDGESKVDEKAGAIKQEPNETVTPRYVSPLYIIKSSYGDISNKALSRGYQCESTAYTGGEKRAASEKADAGKCEAGSGTS